MARLKKVTRVINPSPPVCISRSITVCPKIFQWLKVSTTLMPVTQVAEAAVNMQSTRDVKLPLFEENGSQNSNAHAIMITKKPTASVLAGLSGF